MTLGQAQAILNNFKNIRALVAGDLMLDHWVWGTVHRISPEAPVPVVEVERYTYTPGGAANVINNLHCLGAKTSVLGLVGKDDSGRKLKHLLRKNGVDVSGVMTDPERPTTLKTRIIAHSQQVVRADYEKRISITPELGSKFRNWILQAGKFDLVILSDYDKGMFSDGSLVNIIRQMEGPLILAGPKPNNLRNFNGMHLVTLNASEAAAASGLTADTEESTIEAGRQLLAQLPDTPHIVITRGSEGMTLISRQGETHSIPALASQVFDVSGAGDTVLGVLGLALASGADLQTALTLASHAAAVVVRKIGTATATPNEIISSMKTPTKPDLLASKAGAYHETT